MFIDSIEVFHVALPLRQPLRTPQQAFDVLETVLVRMSSGQAAGWGEASPGNAPQTGSEWAAGAFVCLRDWLVPALCGTTVDSGEDLSRRLDFFRGNRFAKGALDGAWWDLNARLKSRPLHELLGGKRQAIEVGATLDPPESIDDLLAAVGRAFVNGFSRVKLKAPPGWDEPMVEAVRKQFPTQTFHVDYEGTRTLGQLEMFYRLDDFHLAMIEQPLADDDLVGHAMLQESIRTPICLDEGVTTVAQAEMAMELKSCRYMNVTPGRVGGLSAALSIHDLCHDNCVPCWLGAVPQSAVGARIGFALGAKDNFTYPADYFAADQFLQEDLADSLLPARCGPDGVQRVALWTEPGIGIEPRRELLEKYCIARAKLGG